MVTFIALFLASCLVYRLIEEKNILEWEKDREAAGEEETDIID